MNNKSSQCPCINKHIIMYDKKDKNRKEGEREPSIELRATLSNDLFEREKVREGEREWE